MGTSEHRLTLRSPLKVDFDRSEAAGRASQPVPGPDLGKMGAAFNNSQAQVTAAADLIEKLQSEVNVGVTRVEVLETMSNLVHVEAQASFTALGATVAELQAF